MANRRATSKSAGKTRVLLVCDGSLCPVTRFFQTTLSAKQDTYSLTLFNLEDEDSSLSTADGTEGYDGFDLILQTAMPHSAEDLVNALEDAGILDQISKQSSSLEPNPLVLLPGFYQLLGEGAAEFPFPVNLLGYSPLNLLQPERHRVELTYPIDCLDEAKELAGSFFESLGCSVTCYPESPGMVLPRVLACLANEAVSALVEGVASASDIDTAMTLGTNYPMGPLRWADKIGLDVILATLTHLHQVLGDDRYRPLPLLRQKVWANQLGEKTGQGFYHYPDTAFTTKPLLL
ncbi:MAG: hypothetical protein K2X01_08105 [Cyanobacteria bacterium]|nr:hypothetical protein [Cyanobacteriota bacterium]